MILIDLHSNKFLIQLLQQVILGLHSLNKHDPALMQASNKLNEFLSKPTKIDSIEITKIIDKVKDIVKSYDTKENNDAKTLPQLLFNVMEELDHNITKEMVKSKGIDSKIAEIKNQLNTYIKGGNV